LPADFKEVKSREEGDYIIYYDESGRTSIHSWINNKKSGELTNGK
jgi:hypothetical protein